MTAEVPKWIADLDTRWLTMRNAMEDKGGDLLQDFSDDLIDAYPRLRAEAIRAARLEEARDRLIAELNEEMEDAARLDALEGALRDKVTEWETNEQRLALVDAFHAGGSAAFALCASQIRALLEGSDE